MPIFQLKKSEKFFLSYVFKDFEPLHLKNIAPVGGEDTAPPTPFSSKNN